MGKSTLVAVSKGTAAFVGLMWAILGITLLSKVLMGRAVSTGSTSTAYLIVAIAVATMTFGAWVLIVLVRREWSPAVWGVIVCFIMATIINELSKDRAPKTFTPSVAEGLIGAGMILAIGGVLVWQAFLSKVQPASVAGE